MHGVYLVLLLAGAVILGGVVVVAMGRGGEIAMFPRDLADISLRIRTPYDVATLELPLALLGYQERATSEALRFIAHLLAERDAEIERLRAQLARGTQPAQSQSGSPAGAAAAEPSPQP